MTATIKTYHGHMPSRISGTTACIVSLDKETLQRFPYRSLVFNKRKMTFMEAGIDDKPVLRVRGTQINLHVGKLGDPTELDGEYDVSVEDGVLYLERRSI